MEINQDTSFKDFFKKEIRKTEIIKNSKVFEIAYLPNEIFKRAETLDLFQEIARIIRFDKPTHIFLRGLPGTGKTVTVKYLQEQLKGLGNAKWQIIYVNCRNRTAVDILKELNELNSVRLISEEQMTTCFIQNLKNNTILVLDEVDKSRYEISNLLYRLSRISESTENPTYKKLSTILISNKLDWENTLDGSVRSSLQMRVINFNSYNPDQLKSILKERIREGLISQDVISDQLLDWICKMVTEERHGDCRTAIETLFYAAQNVEERGVKTIDMEDVKLGYGVCVKKIEKARIMSLKNHELYVLYAISKSDTKTYANIYNQYKDIIRSKIHERIFSYSKIFQDIKYLEDQNLVRKNKKEGSKELTIELTIDESAVEREYLTRSENINSSE